MSTESVLAGERRFFVGVSDVLDVLRTIPDGSVHVCCTSPPYWGLRDYGTPGQIGLEPTPGDFVAKMVEVFREVRRTLRDDGTLWLNLGDSYAANGVSGLGTTTGNGGTFRGGAKTDSRVRERTVPDGLKPKDLIGMPWRVAFALQEDGWYLRSAITWCKKACMPESVTDRPTSATEMIFLLAKNDRYFYDADAVREPQEQSTVERAGRAAARRDGGRSTPETGDGKRWNVDEMAIDPRGRNLRNYWLLGPEPYAEAHFATFPTEIPRRAILAGTSERGCCPACGAPWRRVVETEQVRLTGSYGKIGDGRRDPDKRTDLPVHRTRRVDTTLGWEPMCAHGLDPQPAVVLDCFSGAGTTGLVALRLGRRYLGAELNPEYAAMSEKRILADQGATAAEVGNVEQPVQLRLGVA